MQSNCKSPGEMEIEKEKKRKRKKKEEEEEEGSASREGDSGSLGGDFRHPSPVDTGHSLEAFLVVGSGGRERSRHLVGRGPGCYATSRGWPRNKA